jgi:hypothetical protein
VDEKCANCHVQGSDQHELAGFATTIVGMRELHGHLLYAAD